MGDKLEYASDNNGGGVDGADVYFPVTNNKVLTLIVK